MWTATRNCYGYAIRLMPLQWQTDRFIRTASCGGGSLASSNINLFRANYFCFFRLNLLGQRKLPIVFPLSGMSCLSPLSSQCVSPYALNVSTARKALTVTLLSFPCIYTWCFCKTSEVLVLRILCSEAKACLLSKPAKMKKKFFWHPSQIGRAMSL